MSPEKSKDIRLTQKQINQILQVIKSKTNS